MLETLSLKLIIDFFTYIEIYKIYLTECQIFIYRKDTKTYQFHKFYSLEDLKQFFIDNYYPYDLCDGFGDIWGLNMFYVTSELNNYQMSFFANDITKDSYILKQTTTYDIDRNDIRYSTNVKQKEFLNKTISEYTTYYYELYDLYLKGIYSPCYAEPGWSENTIILKSYRDALVRTGLDESKFSDIIIETTF